MNSRPKRRLQRARRSRSTTALGLGLLLPCCALAGNPEWDGVAASAHRQRFALTDPQLHASGWVELGESWEGWTAMSYRPAEGTLLLGNGSQTLALRLRDRSVATELTADEAVVLAQREAALREGWAGHIRRASAALDQGNYWVYLDHVANGQVQNRLVIVSPAGALKDYRSLPD